MMARRSAACASRTVLNPDRPGRRRLPGERIEAGVEPVFVVAILSTPDGPLHADSSNFRSLAVTM